MSRQLLDFHPVADMVAEGLPVGKISERAGVCVATVANYLKKHGLKARHANAAPKARTEKIVSMHRQGVSMVKIASQYGMTRERIRQILAKQGITAKDGGGAVTAKKKEEAKIAAKQAQCFAKHGMSLEAYGAAVKAGLAQAFRSQRNAAHGRGIAWGLRFVEWLSIWEESGKLELRGRGIGRYCMSRVNDAGGYELGNVHIQLCTENNSEFITKNHGKRNANTGVYLMYPGLSRPWSARVSRTFLGNFATEQEATAARDSYLSSRPNKKRTSNRLGMGRGYYLCGGKFKVVIAKKYFGLFATEAEAAVASALALKSVLAEQAEAL